jgi:hypothetical protein
LFCLKVGNFCIAFNWQGGFHLKSLTIRGLRHLFLWYQNHFLTYFRFGSQFGHMNSITKHLILHTYTQVFTTVFKTTGIDIILNAKIFILSFLWDPSCISFFLNSKNSFFVKYCFLFWAFFRVQTTFDKKNWDQWLDC